MGVESKLEAISINLSFSETSNKAYQKLQQYRNVTSYSTLDLLHQCPRKFQHVKARAAEGRSGANNVDFAYGHAVGAGVQAWLASGGDMDAAIFNGMLAWTLPYSASIDNKKKSLPYASLAVMKFAEFHEECLSDWGVWILPNGKPAIELSISIHFDSGYTHYAHIDVIYQHRVSGQLAVGENKTSGFKSVEEAIYANSDQALGYSVIIDMLSDDTSYEVFYCVYSTVAKEWSLLPFTKHTSLRAEWITDVKLDHATLDTYHSLNYYPKRGSACFDYMRRCEFFGTCNLTSHLVTPALLAPGEEAERVDYSFHMRDVIARQQAKNAGAPPIETQPTGGNFESID